MFAHGKQEGQDEGEDPHARRSATSREHVGEGLERKRMRKSGDEGGRRRDAGFQPAGEEKAGDTLRRQRSREDYRLDLVVRPGTEREGCCPIEEEAE